MREGVGSGGWTVAFSSPDKSKKERVVINVPKWPRVTGRPSPVTALKRGHLHNHPSHRHTRTHSYTLLVSVCVCFCVSKYGLNKYSPNCCSYACIHSHMEAYHIVFQSSNTVNGFTCIGHTSVPFHSSGSWTLNTGWVALRDHWPLQKDIWPPFFSSTVLGARQTDTNALLIGLFFTMSIAPLSARRQSSVVPHLLA